MKSATLCIFIDDFCCCASWKVDSPAEAATPLQKPPLAAETIPKDTASAVLPASGAGAAPFAGASVPGSGAKSATAPFDSNKNMALFSSRILVEFARDQDGKRVRIPRRAIVRRIGLPVDYTLAGWEFRTLLDLMTVGEPSGLKFGVPDDLMLAAYLAVLIETGRRKVDPALKISSVKVAVPGWKSEEGKFKNLASLLNRTFFTMRKFPVGFSDAHRLLIEPKSGEYAATLCHWEGAHSVSFWGPDHAGFKGELMKTENAVDRSIIEELALRRELAVEEITRGCVRRGGNGDLDRCLETAANGNNADTHTYTLNAVVPLGFALLSCALIKRQLGNEELYISLIFSEKLSADSSAGEPDEAKKALAARHDPIPYVLNKLAKEKSPEEPQAQSTAQERIRVQPVPLDENGKYELKFAGEHTIQGALFDEHETAMVEIRQTGDATTIISAHLGERMLEVDEKGEMRIPDSDSETLKKLGDLIQHGVHILESVEP